MSEDEEGFSDEDEDDDGHGGGPLMIEVRSPGARPGATSASSVALCIPVLLPGIRKNLNC